MLEDDNPQPREGDFSATCIYDFGWKCGKPLARKEKSVENNGHVAFYRRVPCFMDSRLVGHPATE